MNDQTNAVESTEAVEVVKLTREQKLNKQYETIKARIESDTKKLTDIVEEINSIAALAAVDVGSNIFVKLGRKFADKDTTRFEAAVILAVKEEENGSKLFKVQYGVGFDAEIAVVGATSIFLNKPEEVVAS